MRPDAEAAGANALLPKSVRGDALLACLRTVVTDADAARTASEEHGQIPWRHSARRDRDVTDIGSRRVVGRPRGVLVTPPLCQGFVLRRESIRVGRLVGIVNMTDLRLTLVPQAGAAG